MITIGLLLIHVHNASTFMQVALSIINTNHGVILYIKSKCNNFPIELNVKCAYSRDIGMRLYSSIGACAYNRKSVFNIPNYAIFRL